MDPWILACGAALSLRSGTGALGRPTTASRDPRLRRGCSRCAREDRGLGRPTTASIILACGAGILAALDDRGSRPSYDGLGDRRLRR